MKPPRASQKDAGQSPRSFRKSRAFKLSLFFSALIAFVAIAFSIALAAAININIRRNQIALLSNSLDAIENSLQSGGSVPQDAVPYFISFCVYQAGGTVLFTNDPFMIILPKTTRRADVYFERDFYIDGDLHVLYSTRDVTAQGTPLTLQVSLNMERSFEMSLVGGIFHSLGVLFAPIIIISIVLSFFITRRTMRPVMRIARKAETISAENLMHLSDEGAPPFPLSGSGDEFDELSATFNRLLFRLGEEFRRERRFTSDVSHELKTPLTVILGNVNLIRRWGKDDKEQLEHSLTRISDEVASMKNITERLLLLSRLDAGSPVKLESVVLSDEFERLKEETHAWSPDTQFEGAGLDARVTCDRELLHELFTILASNSVRYKKEGALAIRITGEQLADGTRITFSDNGQGIAPDKIDRVFERFFRGTEARTRDGGLGLGLSIAHGIMDSHKGSIKIESDGSSGTTVTLVFPAAG